MNIEQFSLFFLKIYFLGPYGATIIISQCVIQLAKVTRGPKTRIIGESHCISLVFIIEKLYRLGRTQYVSFKQTLGNSVW